MFNVGGIKQHIGGRLNPLAHAYGAATEHRDRQTVWKDEVIDTYFHKPVHIHRLAMSFRKHRALRTPCPRGRTAHSTCSLKDVRNAQRSGRSRNHLDIQQATHAKIYTLTPSTPAFPNCCCSKGSAPYWSNPPFLICDIRARWRSVLSASAPECHKLKMVG